MKVDYTNLRIQLAKRNMTNADLRRKTGISTAILTKLNKGEYVAMSVLDRICKSLDCNLGDVAEFVRDTDSNKTED